MPIYILDYYSYKLYKNEGLPYSLYSYFLIFFAFHHQVRLQTQSVGPGIVPRYGGPLDCLRTIIKEESFRGLFKGTPFS